MLKESKHVKKFRADHLGQNEDVVSFGDGYIGELMGAGSNKQCNGSLIVTNQRVAFYRKGLLGEVLETIPLNSISSIERKSFLGFRSIKMHTSNDFLCFKTSNKQDECDLISAIDAGRSKIVSAVDIYDNALDDSPLNQIKMLSILKKDGVLTEKEFLTKKEALLKKV